MLTFSRSFLHSTTTAASAVTRSTRQRHFLAGSFLKQQQGLSLPSAFARRNNSSLTSEGSAVSTSSSVPPLPLVKPQHKPAAVPLVPEHYTNVLTKFEQQQILQTATQLDKEMENRKWWKEVVVYQVYPRSFKDSNGDGVGDINGITSSLDYLKTLGVDAIWLSPVYKSPNDDNGYDISNYTDIMDEFGTFADWENLVAEAHARGIKIVMDMVLNHSSNQHAWFIEARKSKDNEYRDYYIWRDGKGDSEPNNWVSFFGGSAWDKDEETGQYYLHLFSSSQPDLNWENPKVRKELHDMVEFWCKKGVDGFRMDVINVISKTEGLPDAPVHNEGDMYHWAGEHFFNGPKFMDWMREMKQEVFSKYDIFTVGETPSVTTEHGRKFTEETDGIVNMLFHFELMEVDVVPGQTKWECKPWKLQDIKSVMSKWQTDLDSTGWNSLYLENHDQPRSTSRFGDDSTEELRVLSAKMLATWLLMLKGTPYIYQGQELGMTNVQFPTINEYRDIETFNFYNHHTQRKDKTERELMESIWKKGRDNTRTPMQWNDQPNAGFCDASAKPWIQVNPNYRHVNAELAMKDPNSVFHYYRQLIQLRKQHLISVYGSYQLLMAEDPDLHVYTRTLPDEQLLVITNFKKHDVVMDLSSEDKSKIMDFSNKKLLVSNYADQSVESDFLQNPLTLRPYEARVYHLSGSQASANNS